MAKTIISRTRNTVSHHTLRSHLLHVISRSVWRRFQWIGMFLLISPPLLKDLAWFSDWVHRSDSEIIHSISMTGRNLLFRMSASADFAQSTNYTQRSLGTPPVGSLNWGWPVGWHRQLKSHLHSWPKESKKTYMFKNHFVWRYDLEN